jgi:hypothetical protein
VQAPPASSLPGAPAALPFVTAAVDDPDGECNSVQNYLGELGGALEDTSLAPIGWTSMHLHGGHTPYTSTSRCSHRSVRPGAAGGQR